MTQPPWHAEHDLSPEAFARALERRFVEFEAPQVDVLPEGWDYFAFQVDEDWVFKVPKRSAVVSRMRQEVSLLTALPQMPASIPRPTFHGVASADLPVPFFGYPMLQGRFATEVPAAGVLPQLLDFLDALHGIVPPFAVEETRDAPWEQQVAAVEPILADHPELTDSWRWMADNEPVRPAQKVLLHDDLGPNHVLLAPGSSSVVAVLDWADAARGDAARDLVSLLLWEPQATIAAHRARHGDADELRRAFAYTIRVGLELLGAADRWGRADADYRRTLGELQELL